MAIFGVLALGYLVGFPFLRWLHRDLRGFRRMLWTGYGNRESWTRAAVVSYAIAGWPVLIVAATWRRSDLRVELVIERDDFRSGRGQRGPSHDG